MSTAWYVVKRIAHALGWLWILAIPTAVVTDIATGLLVDAWLEPGVWSMVGTIAESVLACVIIVAMVVVWISAIVRRWSLKWPLIITTVVCWPFGLTWVMMIGLGKLIIHAVGRGSTLAGSDLDGPEIVGARPRGLVEYASYE